MMVTRCELCELNTKAAVLTMGLQGQKEECERLALHLKILQVKHQNGLDVVCVPVGAM